jgi:protein TonB
MPEAPPAPQQIEPRPVAPKPPAAPRPAEQPILPSLFGAGYGAYRPKPTSFIYSYGIVTVLGILLVFIASLAPPVAQFLEQQQPATELVLLAPPAVGHDAGGGTHEKLPASKGAPPKITRTVPLAPPTVHPVPEPVLPTPASVLGPPAPPPVLTAQMGLPAGVSGPASNGSGSGGGIGSGRGGGIGGGTGAYRVGGGVSAPVATFSPEPEYSEEARKAKYQGEVWLTVTIGTDGKAHDIRVSRSLGLGLDEKAIESVRTWKFEPGKKDGVPVAVQISVEVDFHLL